ncbi:MAG: hypothetical protein NXH96_15355 [Alteromonadaceae bacterium]|nr:hypothetical protein [Alteromonadaceae bacterium]
MSQNERYPNQYSDEISLVDLATIFVRRRYVFYGVFTAVAITAMLYVLFLMGEAKEYTTLVQLGEKVEKGERKPFERPATVIATIEARLLPEQKAVYAELNNARMPFDLKAANPGNTSLIKLVSVASPVNAGLVKEAHQKLVDQIVERQNRALGREKQSLSQRLEYINDYLDQMSGEIAAGEAAAEAVQQRVQIMTELESLQGAEILVVGRESIENKGTSKLLVMVLALFLGLMLAFIATFAAEFIAKVRDALQQP